MNRWSRRNLRGRGRLQEFADASQGRRKVRAAVRRSWPLPLRSAKDWLGNDTMFDRQYNEELPCHSSGPRPSRHVASFAASIAAHAVIVGLISCVFASPGWGAGLAIGFSPRSRRRDRRRLGGAAARALARPRLRRFMRSAGPLAVPESVSVDQPKPRLADKILGRGRRGLLEKSRRRTEETGIPKSPVWRWCAWSRPRDRAIHSMTAARLSCGGYSTGRRGWIFLIRPRLPPSAPSAPPGD